MFLGSKYSLTLGPHVGVLHILASDIQQDNPLASDIQQGTSKNARAEVDPYLVATYCSIIPKRI